MRRHASAFGGPDHRLRPACARRGLRHRGAHRRGDISGVQPGPRPAHCRARRQPLRSHASAPQGHPGDCALAGLEGFCGGCEAGPQLRLHTGSAPLYGAHPGGRTQRKGTAAHQQYRRPRRPDRGSPGASIAESMRNGCGYWLQVPKSRLGQSGVAAFRAWLQEEIASCFSAPSLSIRVCRKWSARLHQGEASLRLAYRSLGCCCVFESEAGAGLPLAGRTRCWAMPGEAPQREMCRAGSGPSELPERAPSERRSTLSVGSVRWKTTT